MPLVLLALAAAQVAAPASPPVMQPPHVIAGGRAMGGPMGELAARYRACIDTQVAATPASVTPEAGATLAIATCKGDHDALVASVDAMLANLPADRQELVRGRMAEREAAMPAQVADRIRAARAGAAAPAR